MTNVSFCHMGNGFIKRTEITYPKGIKVLIGENFANGKKVDVSKNVTISKSNPLYKAGLRYFSKQDKLYKNTSEIFAFCETRVLKGADEIKSFIKEALKVIAKVK